MTKSKLKNSPWFHLVDPNELEGIEEWAQWLDAILHNPCMVLERNGETFLAEIRRLVERLGCLNIRIYPNEHAPPHFHVRAPKVDASFKIDSCELIRGSVGAPELRKIRYWHKHAREKLIECWNATRPTDCTVGNYQGN